MTPVPLPAPPDATVERYDTEPEWLAARRRGLGASEAAAVLGLSPFLSAMEVWADKVGLGEPKAELERMRWGRRLQRPIALGYAEDTGRAVVDPSPAAYTILRSRAHPWLSASPDMLLRAPERDTPGVLELKNVSEWTRKAWTDEPPVPYQIQLQVQLLVSGWTWGALAALVGGQELRYQDLEAAPASQAYLLDQLERFWRQHVEREIPPALDGTESTKGVLLALFPKPEPGQVVTLPPEAAQWDADIQTATAAIKQMDGTIETAKNHLRAAIGGAEVGVLPGGGIAWSHKLQTRKEYVVAAWEGRILRRTTIKGTHS